MMRPRMASAMVAPPIQACQCSTGSHVLDACSLPSTGSLRRRPFYVRAVRGGHMGWRRGEAALAAAAPMAGHALPPMHQLRHRRHDTCLRHLANNRERHAVAVALDLDVVVDVYSSLSKVTVL